MNPPIKLLCKWFCFLNSFTNIIITPFEIYASVFDKIFSTSDLVKNISEYLPCIT